MRWASSRAPGTAWGEQQLRSPSVAGSDPQLERHRHHVVAGVERQLRGGGTVHPAAHGHERPPRVRCRPPERRRGPPHPSARWSASAASTAAWRVGRHRGRPGRRPPSSGVTRAASSTGPPSTSSTAALPAAARSAAQPSASKPASATRSPSHPSPRCARDHRRPRRRRHRSEASRQGAESARAVRWSRSGTRQASHERRRGADQSGPNLPLPNPELGLLSEQARVSSVAGHGLPRAGLPSRCCSAQRIRQAGEQVRACGEATSDVGGRETAASVRPWASSFRPSSRSWRSSTGAGAPVSGSAPLAALGNAITSRIESRPASSADDAVDPEGDPAVRRRAVARAPRAGSRSARAPPRVRCRGRRTPAAAPRAVLIRIEPPPSSQPSSTTS